MKREQDKLDREKFRDNVLKMQEEEKLKAHSEKLQKHDIKSKYQQDLSQQEAFKRGVRNRLRQEDIMYASIQEEHAKNNEERRLQYFDQMRKYQDQNEIKMKALANYMVNNDIQSLAQRDEMSYLKAVAEKEERARLREEAD